MTSCNGCSTSCNTTTNTCQNSGGFAFVLVLFILIVLVGAAWLN